MYSSQNLLFLSCKSLPVIVLAYTTSRSQKDLTISNPSDVSFDMIRLAGTVRFEAVTVVSEGCCLWNYKCDIPDGRNLHPQISKLLHSSDLVSKLYLSCIIRRLSCHSLNTRQTVKCSCSVQNQQPIISLISDIALCYVTSAVCSGTVCVFRFCGNSSDCMLIHCLYSCCECWSPVLM
jgi:hypothetical protein